jgi:hypothetical protein
MNHGRIVVSRFMWNLVTDKSTDAVVAWAGDGKSFTVLHPEALPLLLPKRLGLFKESYGGFVRELALYGFRCVASDKHGRPVTFAVDDFERGRFDALKRVRRKANYGRSRRM